MSQKIELADKDVETVTTASIHVFHSEGRLNVLETLKVQKPNWTSRGENYNVWYENYMGRMGRNNNIWRNNNWLEFSDLDVNHTPTDPRSSMKLKHKKFLENYIKEHCNQTARKQW